MFKFLLINFIVSLIFVNSEIYKPLLLPQLPFGEYRINYLGLTRCTAMPLLVDKILFNFYLSKKSANTTEIRGNLTNFVQFDDSLNLELNMAVKDSIGGWKDNAFVFKQPKACTSLKKLFGEAWTHVMEGVGVYNATCPIPVGLYKLSGIDTAVFSLVNFPKTYFYGVYKFRFFFTKNNEVYGCTILVIELKRPWENN
ncbi:uncharacterized protein LOC114128780 [Aphis gossypii]|uniref:MD-2-related lipid-recognition domain-containing protein n=1 Tax=Aphis gossypii TaxID=80765 RepID=A0A9P0NAY6_APHGO|nr:uncharacterized protein LOC114128780 [Aphis gossypii]CAH1714092.1 unnamed protein product [Aphis gossypii]